jgi:hypothetical protein
MLIDFSKVSPRGGFQITQLAQNIAICEATFDRHHWNNGTETKPAFILYLGCNKNEVPMWIEKLNNFYHCYWIEVRKPKHLQEFEAELKILGMKRCSDMDSLGLDYLVNFSCQTGEPVTFQLPEGIFLDSLMIRLAQSGQLEHLTYVSHHYQWIRHWCEAIDGEF